MYVHTLLIVAFSAAGKHAQCRFGRNRSCGQGDLICYLLFSMLYPFLDVTRFAGCCGLLVQSLCRCGWLRLQVLALSMFRCALSPSSGFVAPAQLTNRNQLCAHSFGDDLAGQCGHGEDHLNEYRVPKRIDSLIGRNVVQVYSLCAQRLSETLNFTGQVATGAEHSLVLMDDGSVFAAGQNAFGQAGSMKADQLFIHTEVCPLFVASRLVVFLCRGEFVSA